MNEIVNIFPGRRLIWAWNAFKTTRIYCGPFIENKERIQRFMQTGNTSHIYKNDLDKACFQHDIAYVKYKDLTKRAESDKILRHKAFKIASNPNYDRYKRGLVSMIYKLFDKKSKGSGIKSMYKKKNLQMNFIN